MSNQINISNIKAQMARLKNERVKSEQQSAAAITAQEQSNKNMERINLARAAARAAEKKKIDEGLAKLNAALEKVGSRRGNRRTRHRRNRRGTRRNRR